MQRMTYEELVERLRELKKKGYVRTHRRGDTGIGKTLEDLLGIEENNVPGPNAKMLELKSARKGSASMLTLFTKSPLPRTKAISELVKKFGYPSPKDGRKILHATLRATAFTSIKGRRTLTVGVNDRIEIVSVDGETLGYWDNETLRKTFEKKLPALLYVKANSGGRGNSEEFWFDEAWHLKGFSFENFKNLVREGVICVDLRIGQYPDGRPHDHGTGFRIQPDKLELCFEMRERIM